MLARLVRLTAMLALAVTPALASALPVAGQATSPTPSARPTFPDVAITAKSAVVVDDATGQVVWAKNPHERRAPASITKIMTALVALEYDYPTRVVTVHEDWYDLADSSIMGLRRGERLSIEDLLYGLMLPSGNDAAVALARAVAGSETNYVGLMNAEAQRLGLKDTHFVNPHGLDAPGHYTSAYDITMLARYAMRDPEFRKIVGTRQIDVRGLDGSYFPLTNIMRFMWHYPGADGVKPGYTDNAGQTYVATAVRNGRRAYVGLLGSSDDLTDSTKLMDAYFQTYGSQPPPPVAEDLGIPGTPARVPADQMPPHHWLDIPPTRSGSVPACMRAQ